MSTKKPKIRYDDNLLALPDLVVHNMTATEDVGIVRSLLHTLD
jgi:hypothetical protein